MERNIKRSFLLNLLIFVLTLLAVAMIMTGFRFSGGEAVLTAKKLAAFKYFTMDSNVLMGLTALLYALWERKREPPVWLRLLKLTATVGVTLTLLTVALFLGPFVMGMDRFLSLYADSNLFLHLIIPLLSIVAYVCTERSRAIRFRQTWFGVIPMVIYGAFYMANVLRHMEGGRVSFQYDWYGFAQGGPAASVVVFFGMILVTWLISVVLWRMNRGRGTADAKR